MPAQLRESRKNYIGLLSDETGEQRFIESPARPDHRAKDYFKSLIAAVLHRHRNAR